MKAETVVLGRGPLGIFTSYKLIKNGYSVLNIDAGIQIKNLKKSLKVSSNVDWKSKRQAPSFNIEGSDYHWGGRLYGMAPDR